MLREVLVVSIILLSTFVKCDEWLGSIISKSLLGLEIESNEEKCARDIENYRKHLKNNTLWAVKMSEASTGSINGIISGNMYHFGHFDQCISVNVPVIDLRGKYCLVKLRYWPNATSFPNFLENNITAFKQPSNFDSVWKALQVTKDLRFQRRDIVYVGICVPSSCSSQVVQDSLTKITMEKILNQDLEIEFQLSEKHCTVTKGNEDGKPIAFYIFIGIFIALLMLVTIGTIFQIYNESQGDYKGRWYYALSLIFNTQKLLKGSSNELGPGSGLKVLSMFIVIYGHRYLLSLYGPVINMNENEQRYGKFWETYILNGNIVVNTFFCVSGYIIFYKILVAIDAKQRFSFFGALIYRWMRVTVVYALTILFMVSVLKYVGSGPLWHNATEERQEICESYWWTNLLYINNYIFPEQLCLIPGWYLACDMQLFIFTLLIGFIYKWNYKMGIIVFSIFFAISVLLIPTFFTFFGKFSGTTIFYIRTISEFQSERDYVYTYITTHFRLSSHMVGMGAAILHNYFQKRKIVFPFWAHVVLAFSTIPLTGLSLLGAWRFYLPGGQIDEFESTFYAVYSKLIWAVNMCWIIMTSSTGGKELLTSRILSSKMFMVLNKLNLSALLVHTPLQFILIMSFRTPQYVTHFTAIWMACSDIMLCYVASFVVYLLVEAPFSNFTQNLLKL